MADTPLPTLRLHGSPAVRLANGRLHALERKHAALLAYIHIEGPTARSRLAGLLWPNVAESRARGNLRQRLSRLKRDVGELVHDRAGVLALVAALPIEPPDPPGAALLAPFFFDDCDAFSRWLEGRREAEREQRKREWLQLVREAAQSMRLDDALFAADQLLQTDRESEEAYRVLMEVFYLRGDHAAAVSTWDRCREMLRSLYGLRPSTATRELAQTILHAAGAEGDVSPLVQPSLPAAVLRPPLLVAREAAMASLYEGWGAGDAVCVTGEAGMGKTRLLAEFIAKAGDLVFCASRPGDEVLPYSTLSRLVLTAVDRFEGAVNAADARLAARLLPRLEVLSRDGSTQSAPVVPDRLVGVRNEYERAQALLATARLLLSCVKEGCSGFVLDDLQFADPASVEAMRMLAEPDAARSCSDGSSARALRFIFATRPEEAGAEAQELLASLAATGRLRRIELAPLTESEAIDVLSSVGLVEPDVPALAARVWRQVGGNPAFLLESLKLLMSLGPPAMSSEAVPLPSSIETVIQRRIGMLTPRARHLAQLAAIAGAGYSVGLAASVLACPVIELTEPLRELELRQVFYGRQFVHDLIGEVVRRGVPDAVAEFTHRFVAEYLLDHDAEPVFIAGHWRACHEWRRAGQQYVAAAARAAAAARLGEQGALLDQAIDCFERDRGADDELFAALLQRAEAAEARSEPSLRAAQVVRLLKLARSPLQRLQALATEIGWHTNAGRTDVALAAVEAGMAESLALGRPDLALQIAHPLSWQLAMRGRLDDALAVLALHENWATQIADVRTRAFFHRTRAAVFGFCDRLQCGIDEGRHAVQALREAEDWAAMLPALSNLGLTHHWRGELEAARDVLEEARELRQRVQAGGAALMIDVHLGGVMRDLGDTDAALALLEPVHAILRDAAVNDLDSTTERVIVENHLAEVWIARNEPQRARESIVADDVGVGPRFCARRRALRLRIERLFGGSLPGPLEALQAFASTIDSSFALVLVELELAKLLPAAQSAAAHARLHAHPAAQQRPGLQLHAAACAADALFRAGRAREANSWAAKARMLMTICHPYDLPVDTARRLISPAAMDEPKEVSRAARRRFLKARRSV